MDMKNISSKWKWIAGIVVVLLISLFAGRVKRNGGSVTVQKNVSFVKQAKGSGTHVWFMTAGKVKISDFYYIVVLKNGKARTYRIYDDDTTLGKVSKMSNGEAIRYAKQQDKKYFNASVKDLGWPKKTRVTMVVMLISRMRSTCHLTRPWRRTRSSSGWPLIVITLMITIIHCT